MQSCPKLNSSFHTYARWTYIPKEQKSSRIKCGIIVCQGDYKSSPWCSCERHLCNLFAAKNRKYHFDTTSAIHSEAIQNTWQGKAIVRLKVTRISQKTTNGIWFVWQSKTRRLYDIIYTRGQKLKQKVESVYCFI